MSRAPRASDTLGWIAAATSFGFVVVQLDVTIVNVALPRIGADLAAPVASLQWVVDAYTLAFAVLLLSAGALADRLGARRVYVAGFALFALASAACGLATDATTLIAARALQGVGAALLVPSSLTLLNRLTGHDRAMRARAVGLWTAAGGVSIAAGPIAGALLLESLGWRSIFLVNLPLCVLGAWLAFKHLPADQRGDPHEKLDPAGQLLAIVSLTALTAAVIESARLGAMHPAIVGAFALAILAGIAFCMVEARVATPMLPLGLFRLPTFSAATVFGILVNLTYYGVLFVLSLYLQRAHGYSAIEAGLAYLPLTATFIVSNLVSGAMVARFGSRVPMIAGALMAGSGYALLSRLDASSSYWAMLPAFALIPGGMGLAVPAMTTTILASVERRRAGTASAVLNAARQVGGTIGVAVFGALVAGDDRAIVAGLHAAAIASTVLLLVAALLAWLRIHASIGAELLQT